MDDGGSSSDILRVLDNPGIVSQRRRKTRSLRKREREGVDKEHQQELLLEENTQKRKRGKLLATSYFYRQGKGSQSVSYEMIGSSDPRPRQLGTAKPNQKI
jgi:hypothetical protein